MRMALPLAVVDLRRLRSPPARWRSRALAEQAQAPFDLVNGPLLRVAVLRLAEQQHLLVVTLHHIVADHWSFGILLREFVALYDAAVQRAPASLPAPGLAYLDFAVWQRQWLAAGQLQRQLDYWQRTLGDDHRLSRLPGSPQAGVSAGTCQVHAFDFPPALAEALRATAKARGLTLYMLLLAGFSLVVAQRCDSPRVRLGTDVANRNHAGVEEMVGFFVNQLVLQLTLDDSLSGEQWLERCRDVVVGASDHQDLPFDRLVEALRLPRQAGRSPLFAIKFIYQEGSLPMQAPRPTGDPAGRGAGRHRAGPDRRVRQRRAPDRRPSNATPACTRRPTCKGCSCSCKGCSSACSKRPSAPGAVAGPCRTAAGQCRTGGGRGAPGAAQGAAPDPPARPWGRAAVVIVMPVAAGPPALPGDGNVQQRGASRSGIGQGAAQEFEHGPRQPRGLFAMFEGHSLPLLCTPKVAGINLAEWAGQNRALIESKLDQHATILFRGFAVQDIGEFNQCVDAISGGALEYLFRARRVPRSPASTMSTARPTTRRWRRSSRTTSTPIRRCSRCTCISTATCRRPPAVKPRSAIPG
jgi:hypothetical protein